MRVTRKKFEKWVIEAVDKVPERFRKKINNLAIFVEDYPNGEQLRKAGLKGKKDIVLFGLYEGYHQSKKLDLGLILPDRITLFQRPIESYGRKEEEIKKLIESTIRHEIAHHFGSDEGGAEKAGRDAEQLF